MPKKEKERRVKLVMVRLTAVEWRQLSRAAKEEGATVAWMFRRWAFGNAKNKGLIK